MSHGQPKGIDGARVEKILDMGSITLNKNSVPGDFLSFPWCSQFSSVSPLKKYLLSLIGFTLLNSYCIGDKSALVPGGIRIGMPAMTTRGFKEKDFLAAADLIHEGVQMALEVKRSVSGTKLKDFMEYVESPEFLLKGRISDLKRRVEALATQFPLPGV